MSGSWTCFLEVIDQCRASNRLLPVVVAKWAHGDGVLGELVAADDDGDRRAAAVGDLHLRLHAAVLVRAICGEAGGAKFGGQSQRLEAACGVDDERVERRRPSRKDAFVVASDQRAVEAQRKTDSMRWGAAERLDQSVVTATST